MKFIGALLELLLLLLSLAYYATAAPANRSSLTLECNREFLLSINHDSEGITLSILVTSINDYEINDIPLLHLPGQRPPSHLQCGEDNFRCKNPLTLRNTFLNSTVLFVPLHDALLLVNFVLSDTGITLEEYHLINLTRFNINCSPVTSFKILDSVYTICLNVEESSYLALFEIRLNSESLTRTAIVGPLAQSYFYIQNTHLSEFKYIELYNFHFIYYAYTNYLYYFDPFNYVLEYAGFLHPNCTSVKELAYIGDDTLLGYCREGASVYFNLNDEYSTLYQPYSRYGKPFLCPNLSVVFLQDGYIQLSNASETITNRLELMGKNFVSGECFGNSGDFYFVYIDQFEGTFVFDLTTFNSTQLSTNSCPASNLKCKPVQVLHNQYIIVQQWENNQENLTNSNGTALTSVFDAQNNFRIITTLNRSSNFVSVVAKDIDSCPRTAPTHKTVTHMATNATTIPVKITEMNKGHENISTTQLPTTSPNSEVTLAIVIGIAGLVLILLMVVATSLILIVFIRQSENKSNSRHMTDSSVQAVILMSARKLPCSTSQATGLEQCSTAVLMESKEKASVERLQYN